MNYDPGGVKRLIGTRGLRSLVVCVAAALACCATLGATSVAAGPASDLVGTWTCCGSGGAGAQTWKISSINASSGSFTGSGGGGGITFPIKGTLSGRSVKLTTGPYTQEPSYTATFTGTVATSGKSMSGGWTSNHSQSGTWTATLSTPLKKLKPKPKPKKPKPKKPKPKKPKPKPKKPKPKKPKPKKPKPKKPKPKKPKPTPKGKSTLSLHGASSNTLGQLFNWTMSGFAASPANFVEAWETVKGHNGCASTFAAEASRGDKVVFVSKAVTSNAHVSLVIHFRANNTLSHNLCAYLINSSTRKTYAKAVGFWSNHR